MALLDPVTTSAGDLIAQALVEAGVVGVGQSPTAEDTQQSWARLQWMLQGWASKRWLVYHLVTKVVTSTGAVSYTVGPGGDFDTGAATLRPDKIESGFLRQLASGGALPIDYDLGLIQSMEGYNLIALKTLQSFSSAIFYDPAYPLGKLYPWPVPNPTVYAIGITIKEQLPVKFPTLATVFTLPFQYFEAILYNLAIRLRSMRQIATQPGDALPGLAKDGLGVLRTGNTAIAELQTNVGTQSGGYNIFSDRAY